MNKGKENYQNIPLPDGLSDAVRKGIKKGKRHMEKKWIAAAGTLAAACVLGFVVLKALPADSLRTPTENDPASQARMADSQSGQTPERPAKEEDAPAKPEDGQTQKPEDGQTAEQPQGQEPAVEAWKLGLLAYAGQLNIQPEVTAEVPVEGQAAHLVAAVPEGEAAQAAPVAQAATEERTVTISS